jgi:uncharacterized membrane protein YagU involved in acid resistance
VTRSKTLLPGFAGTVVLTSLLAASQGIGLTRINLPFLLGTMFTPDRERARLVGFGVHLVNGWLFATVYAATFERLHRATWWLGAVIGFVHSLFVLLAAMPALPSLHPRMASEEQGPTPTRQLQPPGFLALNYGRRTPLSVVLAHLAYGAVLGLLSTSPVDRGTSNGPDGRRTELLFPGDPGERRPSDPPASIARPAPTESTCHP